MIEVYHGTSYLRARKICMEQIIRATDQNNARYNNTPHGYVYVTTKLCDAMSFSSLPENDYKMRVPGYIIVFKIMVDKCELEDDEQERQRSATHSVDGGKHCYKINRNLIFGKDVKAVFCKSFGNDENAVVKFMDDVEYEQLTIREDEWRTLC